MSSSNSGLQKQKYFCQTCNRQCNDKDGFLCHLKSNTHRINMEKIAENPEYFINNYSYEFEKGFVDILKRNYKDAFVSANKIYQEYICDKFATHLNATRWTTLTGFIKSLELKGNVEMKANDKEILIMYSDIKPDEKFQIQKKLKEEKLEEIKRSHELKKIIINANEKLTQNISTSKSDKINMESENVDYEKLKNISISIGGVKNNIFNDISLIKPSMEFLNKKRHKEDQNEGTSKKIIDEQHNKISQDDKKIAVSNIETKNEMEFDLVNNPWIESNLIVRIKDKKLPYLNKKGIINSTSNEFLAEVKLLNSGSNNSIKIQIDQAYLEPVIPSPGPDSIVKILYGEFKGMTGVLESLNIHNTSGEVSLLNKKIKINLKQICKFEK